MIGGDGINDESKKMSPAPLDYFNSTKHTTAKALMRIRQCLEVHMPSGGPGHRRNPGLARPTGSLPGIPDALV